jgi:hypothetical protein
MSQISSSSLDTLLSMPTINPNLKEVNVECIWLGTLAADARPVIPAGRQAIATLCGPIHPKVKLL